ncbi:MAG: SMP-30/gluconolactonase/LRE family protein, partial [Gemmatimonadota bacterium]
MSPRHRCHRRPLVLAVALPAAALLATACGDSGQASPGGEASSGTPAGRMEITGGFETPESVLHDPVDDVYLVSNVSGAPLEVDGNGFISRVSPEGDVMDLRWIDGADEAVTLNAPKGMAILGDTLYVADIDCVRMFVRPSGEPAGQICFPDASFLNDVAVDPNNTLYVTDSGLDAAFEGTGTDAVYRFSPDGRRAPLLQGSSLGRPNGIAFGSRGGFVATFGSGEIYQIAPDGSRNTVLPASDRQLDGIVFTRDGGFLFSSWGNQAVYQVTAEGQVSPVVEGVAAPADIGYDATRNRVLIPLFNDDRIVVQELGAAAD